MARETGGRGARAGRRVGDPVLLVVREPAVEQRPVVRRRVRVDLRLVRGFEGEAFALAVREDVRKLDFIFQGM